MSKHEGLLGLLESDRCTRRKLQTQRRWYLNHVYLAKHTASSAPSSLRCTVGARGHISIVFTLVSWHIALRWHICGWLVCRHEYLNVHSCLVWYVEQDNYTLLGVIILELFGQLNKHGNESSGFLSWKSILFLSIFRIFQNHSSARETSSMPETYRTH